MIIKYLIEFSCKCNKILKGIIMKINYFFLLLLFTGKLFASEIKESANVDCEILEIDYLAKPVGQPFIIDDNGLLKLKCCRQIEVGAILEIIIDTKLLQNKKGAWLVPGDVLKNCRDSRSRKPFKLGKSFEQIGFLYFKFTNPSDQINNPECCAIL